MPKTVRNGIAADGQKQNVLISTVFKKFSHKWEYPSERKLLFLLVFTWLEKCVSYRHTQKILNDSKIQT